MDLLDFLFSYMEQLFKDLCLFQKDMDQDLEPKTKSGTSSTLICSRNILLSRTTYNQPFYFARVLDSYTKI